MLLMCKMCVYFSYRIETQTKTDYKIMLTIFMVTLITLAFIAVYNAYKPATAIDYSVLNNTYHKLSNPAHVPASDIINMIIPTGFVTRSVTAHSTPIYKAA